MHWPMEWTALISVDLKTNKIKYAGANRPLCVVRNGELKELSPTKLPIGFVEGVRKRFETTTYFGQSGDMLYLFSDGYTDQFGGENIKKFNRARFRTLLSSLGDLSAEKQQMVLEESFRSWKGEEEQLDDVTVMGVRL